MEKKIIAIALVLVLMVTAFVGCSKKLETTNINGVDYVLATDEEGNTIIEDGHLVIHPTNKNGKIALDENGEKQTNKVDIRDNIMIYSDDYKFMFPEGWDRLSGDAMSVKGNINISIRINDMTEDCAGDVNAEYKNIEQMVDAIKRAAEEEHNMTATLENADVVITSEALEGKSFAVHVKKTAEETYLYCRVYVFEHNEKVYAITYFCNGNYYDETLDVLKIINENLIFE